MKNLAKIATLLTVYLAWICGTTFIALSCHATRDRHIHCCTMCECHHDDCNKAHIEAPHACHHDHSNKVVLYDTSKRNTIDFEPVTLCVTAQLDDDIAIENRISVRQAHNYERGVPIPPSPTLSRRGMRAPPVVA